MTTEKRVSKFPRTIKKMKIIRIIARLNVGGPARHIILLTKEFQSDDFESVLLAGNVPEGEEDMSYLASENAVEPIYIKEMSREISLLDVVSLWKIYRRIQREKPDIIHTHTAKAGTVGRAAGFLYRWLTWGTLLGKPRRLRIVHTFHGHIFHSYYGKAKTQVFIIIEKLLARFASDKIIVISAQQFREIHEEFGVGKREQFEIIPLGIDLETFSDGHSKQMVLREEIGAADDELLVGIVGRLTEVKNHSLFLKAAKLCREKPDAPKMRFLIIGDGHLREEIEREAQTLGIKDLVAFLGNRNDTDVFYSGLDLVALTSLNEGTPLSLIEAMACEKAVISTQVGGVADLLGDVKEKKGNFQICERGIAVASEDAESFADGLIHLANDASLRAALGGEGKTFVEAQYGKARLINDMKKFYRELTRI